MAKATKYKPYKFPYNWNIADGYPSKNIEFHGSKVFGTFVCGGGSSMGYKLAGYEHLGGVEIDPKVGEVYKLNHKPKHFYLEDIRFFNKRNDLPKELYSLDLLDGSPPCSSFSIAGNRDKDWGKEKVFREGQELQRLDDLVFEYIKTIDKLKPKVAILENVKGLIQGNAKAYTKKIFKEFTKAGYRVQLFLLNAASMGVPQKRERVFFIGLRNDFDLPKLVLQFNEKPILFGEIAEDENGKAITGKVLELWKSKRKGEKTLEKACLRTTGKANFFGTKIQLHNEVSFTIIASSASPILHDSKPFEISNKECKSIGTYPQDYNFKDIKPKYLIGMSVPPICAAQISHQIHEQWLKKIK
jgi:DNA (cytosine-5)-methyltransferase 1